MNNIIKSASVLVLYLYSAYAISSDCTDVIRLSAISSSTIQDENSFIKDASNFCKTYSKNKGGANAQSVNVGYGGFSFGGATARSSSSSLAEKLCKSSNLSELRDNAYKTYIRTIAPQAYSSYNQCIKAGNALKVSLLGGTENTASIRVAYNAQNKGLKGGITVDTDDSIKCSWKNSSTQTSEILLISNGQSKILKCKRDSSE